MPSSWRSALEGHRFTLQHALFFFTILTISTGLFRSSQLQGQSPPAPIRFTKKAAAEEDADEVDGEQEEDGGQDAMDLLPRTDVG